MAFVRAAALGPAGTLAALGGLGRFAARAATTGRFATRAATTGW